MSTELDYLMEAIQGQYGEEAMSEAIQRLDELDIEIEWGDDDAAPDQPEPDERVERFGREAERLEKHVGRKLTQGEVNAIVDEVAARPDVPDLVETYGDRLQARESTTDGRNEVMAEEFEENAADLEAQEEAAALPALASSPEGE